MPPKRKVEDSESGPAKKKAATGPKLKKSKAPNWDSVSDFSFEKPTGEWARKRIERWCELSALDKTNSPVSVESKAIVSRELGQDTWKLLRKAAGDIAAIVLGSKLEDEDRKKQIARTLLGSLYFTELWGNDEGDGSPREVQIKTRLYSPFGVGTSIDFFTGIISGQGRLGPEKSLRFYVSISWSLVLCLDSTLADAKSRLPMEIDSKNPTKCSTIALNSHGVWKAGPDATTVFERNGKKSKGTTPANVKSFEETLFSTEGWMSPLKLVETLFAAATVMRYGERDTTTPKSVLEKFHYFDGVNNSGSLLTRELDSLTVLEAKEPTDQTEVCMPQRWLLLARHGGVNENEPGTSGQVGGA
ncbi:unnamed protein product [Rhizoctonia solani]|uniref:Uncharacterized protein n=1 Tax=Rhizoctonia solani TaxID=456999 RepID=A0A8H3AGR7_9AGAM|nr:unnamed protein product [Rhizoctonia solani]